MNTPRNAAAGSLPAAIGAGLQWRLLLLWVLALLVPAAVATWPVQGALGALLDHSVHSRAWAEALDIGGMGDVFAQLGRSVPAISGAATAAALLALLLGFFLDAMVVAAARSAQRPGLGELLHGGLHEYGRMLRAWLWCLLSWAALLGLGGMAFSAAERHGRTAMTQGAADLAGNLALVVFVVLFVLAHAIAESTRGQFIADPALQSARRAFGRALRTVFRRPLATLWRYGAITVPGLVVALLLVSLRVRVPAAGTGGVIFAFALTQLLVLTLAWMHIARMHALALGPRRGGGLRP